MSLTKKQLLKEIDNLIDQIGTSLTPVSVEVLHNRAHGFITFGLIDKQIALGRKESDVIALRIDEAQTARLAALDTGSNE
ncbi:hypothetical protein ACEN2T_17305 [Pseudomonas sp. W22_MBD1_FP4]|uniref:hypothetical protein n=1 Tax=Pseudomonas sp. W22_MBD1_FP4 TaxID=3240272 RepID=UPI003F9C32B8